MERNQNEQLACRKEVTPTGHAVNWQANAPYLVERYFLVWPQTSGRFVFRALAIQPIRRFLNGLHVETNGQPKTPSLLVYSSSHDTKESRILRSAMLASQLAADTLNRRRVSAARACSGAAFHRAVELRVLGFGSRVILVHPAVGLLHDYSEVHALGLGPRHELQGHG